nr:MAG TPA: hypothetical protein [Caudoviricetes sp.]
MITFSGISIHTNVVHIFIKHNILIEYTVFYISLSIIVLCATLPFTNNS